MFLSQPKTTDAVARMYKSNQAAQGFVMNLTSAWAWRPDVFESFAALRNQLASSSSLSKRDQAVLGPLGQLEHGSWGLSTESVLFIGQYMAAR